MDTCVVVEKGEIGVGCLSSFRLMMDSRAWANLYAACDKGDYY